MAIVSLLEDGSARLAHFEDSISRRRGVLRRDRLAALTLWHYQLAGTAGFSALSKTWSKNVTRAKSRLSMK